ncbi:T9SS type A sorting domain-containing protein [Hymenobacter yonginensis]|uniref:T9SS type A sorting domain-containing protein n=1 Tax=Hymenobacter yonginensis TaxID=748197 RepID=A0ABY7PUD6_9BACT|nr:T9SS type A sorting domain-containing protein [Hymenobacter yonginensis]WBO86499.1 T9SS type A sorting domain-containing protein [Hymenobacter yonginensis]
MITRFMRVCLRPSGFLTGAALLVSALLPRAAAAQTWQKTLAAGSASTGFSVALETASAPGGDVYVAGEFSGSLQLGATTLVSAGLKDVFVARWSAADNRFVWAQRAGGPEDEFFGGVAAAGTSVYLAGTFGSSTASFGTISLQNAGAYNLFVAKLTDAGSAASFTWAQRAGGLRDDEAFDVAVSGTSVYVSGAFSSSSVAFGASQLNLSSFYDLFVAKLTDAGSTGSFVWAQQATGTGSEEGVSLAAEGSDVYVSGVFNGLTARFGNTLLTNSGDTDGFLARLTDNGPTGSFVWAQSLNGIGSDFADAVAVSGDNVYVAGSFASPTLAVGAATLTSAGLSDAFVAKFTRGGTFGWARRAGGSGDDQASGMAVQGSRVYVTGVFESIDADFGSATLASIGSYDVFVTRLQDAGSSSSFQWTQRAGGPAEEFASGLTVDGANVSISGGIGGPATFGSQSMALPAASVAAAFVARLTDAGALAMAEPAWAAGLQLYPNPAPTQATVRLAGATGPVQVQLLDAVGRVVHTAAASPAQAAQGLTLPLTHLVPALYRLSVRAGGQQVFRQLAVQ